MTDTARKIEADSALVTPGLGRLSLICFLAWFVPGAGHLILKRPKHAAIFFVLITFLWFWGLSLGAKLYQYEAQQPLTFFAMVAQIGMGLPYIIARYIASFALTHPGGMLYSFAENFRFGTGDIENITFEYGNTFAIVAGLLNLLVVLDAYDIAVGRKKGKHA